MPHEPLDALRALAEEDIDPAPGVAVAQLVPFRGAGEDVELRVSGFEGGELGEEGGGDAEVDEELGEAAGGGAQDCGEGVLDAEVGACG